MRIFLKAGLSLIMFSGSFCLYAQAGWQSWNTGNSALPDNSVSALTADPDGNLWIGTENGLAYFNGNNFTVYTSANSALPDNDIRALAADPAGIWIGTFTGGLVRGMGNSFTVYNTNNSALPENQIRDIKTNSQGAVWVATTGGLARLHNGQFTVWNTTNSGLTSNNITAIALAPDGSRFLATINGGLLHQTNSSVQVFTYQNSQLPDNSALSLATTPAGELLIGTTTAGLTVFHSDTVFQTYSPQNSGNLTYTVPALATDGVGNWFLGSELAGLIRKSGTGWTSFNTQNSGIPANHVQAILVEPNGVVWVGTRGGGLAKFTYEPTAISGFTEESGLQLWPNPISSGSPIKMSAPLTNPYVVVRNCLGQTVLEKTIAGNTDLLPALNLPAGIYHIRLAAEEKVYLFKVVVY